MIDLSSFVFDEQYKAEVQAAGDLLWLVKEFQRLRKIKDSLEEQLTEINKAYDFIRVDVIPTKLDDAGVSNATFPGIGRLQVTADAHVSIVAGRKEDAYGWLEDRGLGDLIQPYIQPSTLKASIIKIYREGEFDSDFETLFNVRPFRRASITKVASE
jgi:hypothetical protein